MTRPVLTLERVTESVAQTVALAAGIAPRLEAGDVVALTGDLGAGKTQFVRGLAEGLGLDPRQVASPTYVLAHEYEPEASGHGRGLTLVHVDAYRLRSLDELESAGLTVAGPTPDDWLGEAVLAIEWSDRLAELPGSRRLEVTLSHAGESRRRVHLRWVGRWHGPAEA